jgi:hypothetical protein
VFGLQLRAFGANPSDPDIAGNLAFVYLKLSPPQPETARQVALHAMALRGTQLRAARPDDWTTFAIASALVGREDDARNALYVAVAVTRDLELSCRAVLSSLASYGDPMRRPVRAMMERIQAYGRSRESPYGNWAAVGGEHPVTGARAVDEQRGTAGSGLTRQRSRRRRARCALRLARHRVESAGMSPRRPSAARPGPDSVAGPASLRL